MKKYVLLFFGLALFITTFVQANNDRSAGVAKDEPAQDTERRVALVIGNSNYAVGFLPNPVNDATDMAKVLSGVGFKVQLKTDLTYKQMIQAIQTFGKEIQNGGVGLFFYAGHGAQVNGENYLIPVGTNIEKESEIPYESVNAGWVLAQMEEARNRLNIVILDACRNNPFARSGRSGERGLRIVSAPSGTFIGFAAAPGQTASDGTGRNSPYTAALLQYIPQAGLKIEDVFKRVLSSVRGKTDSRQMPWVSNSFEGDFCFVGNCGAGATEPTTQPVTTPTTTAQPPKPTAENNPATNPPKQEHVELQSYTETVNGVGIEMVRVPSGKFLMGSPDRESDADEHPQHTVTLSSFYMGKYEVTQAQWGAVAKLPKVKIDLPADPSYFKGNNLPVEQVSWEEAVEFCDRLTRATGKPYRLPTEAEREYACRAGTPGMYAGSVDEMGWYGNNSGRLRIDADEIWRTDQANYGKRLTDNGCQTHPVGQKQPNGFGLYDMHGNVWEWCMDWYGEKYYSQSGDMDPKGPSTGSLRVNRGGSWDSGALALRSAGRNGGAPTLRLNLLGFRLVRTYN